MKKFERKTKDERRRVLLSKNNELSYTLDNDKLPQGTQTEAGVLAKSQDLTRRFVAAFLALVFALTTMVLGVNLVVRADNDAVLKPAKVVDDDSSMVLNKYLTPANDGTYNLTLEAYTTAKMKTVKEKIPTDFVIVVDQSGSMADEDMPTGEPTLQNNKYLEDIAEGKYYYKDGDNYYRVYGIKDYLYRYHPANSWFTGDIVKYLGTDIGWFMGETDATTNIENAFYFREVVDGKAYYLPIKTTIEGKIGTYYMRFQYPSIIEGTTYEFDREVETYSSNGNSPWYHDVLGGRVINNGALYSAADYAVQTLYQNDKAYTYSEVNLPWPFSDLRTGMYVNYPMFSRSLSYTKLCYRDVNGIEHEVPSNNNQGQTTWEFCDDDGNAISNMDISSARPTYSGLYTFDTYQSRLAALKVALNGFAQAVANETDDFGAVDNKISIVGFSSNGYSNTEVLTNTDLSLPSAKNGWQKNTADGNTSEYYGKALVSPTNGTVGTVNEKISDAINALTANGGTQPEDGLNMAYQILTNRGTTKYTIRSGSEKGQQTDRNKIVIFFTDGQPGNYHYSNQYSEANDVVEQAKYIKDYDTTLFSIGVFGESDGNPLTYADTTQEQSKRSQWKYLGGWMETHYSGGTYYCLRRQWRPNGSEGYTETANDTIFDYMSVTSSNYPDAEDYIAPQWLAGEFSGNYIAATDGIRHKETAEQTNKYYRMASNQDTLVAAFLEAVSMDNTETTNTIKMDANAVLTDVIDTSSFVLPNNPTATVQTAKYTLNSSADTIEDNLWTTPEDSSLEAVWNGNQVTVTGFDYSTNYIAWDKPATGDLEANTGRKIIVTIPGLKPIQNITTIATKILYSNTNDASVTSGDGETVVHFAMPYISRHSYTLDVQGDNKANAKFDVTASLTGGTSSLDDVILVKPNGERVKYSSAQTFEFEMSDTQTFYFENVPSDYSITTSVKAKDNDYTYTMWANCETTNKSELNTQTGTDRDLVFADNTLHIDSVANTHSATLTLSTEGEFANKEREFPIGMTITTDGGTGYTGDVTLGDGTVLHFTNGTLSNTDDLKLKDGDSVVFTDLPAGSSVTITPSDDPGNVYTWKASLDNGTEDATAKTGVIDQDGHVFHVVYTRGEVTDTGVLSDDSTTNILIYALAGMAVMSGGAGVAYMYRKKAIE